jgi:hypothetical protein
MSSDPTQPTQQTWWQTYRPLITWVAVTLTLTIAGAIGGWQAKPVPPPVTVEVEKEVEKPIPQLDEFTFGMGWIQNEDVIAENRDPAKTLHFVNTPAGKVAQGDEDVFLYRAVRKAVGKAAPWYPNVNQESVGCCVGCGFKHGCDVVQATAIAAGQRFEWKAASVEVIYSISRIDVGRGQIRGDGSMGAWAAAGLKEVGALAPMEVIGSTDLSKFSPSRAREWGSRGVPAEVKAVAKGHPVKGAALVTSAVDVKRALQQGYPVAVCSNVGFNNRDGSVGTRDAQGFCVPRGTWNHCMLFLAWRNGNRPGALCLNSWGDRAHGGPVWPDDMPVAAFWIDESTVDRMVKQGDSFALADVAGFPARRVIPDWFVEQRPERFRPQPLTLANEVALSW